MASTCLDFDYAYRDLTKHFTRLIIDELNSCRHPCLKNPQNRSSSSEDDRVRFRIIARPPGFTVSGKRNMNLGHSEALLFIHGQIKDENMSGLDLKVEGSKYRWAFGELVESENIPPYIRENIDTLSSNKVTKITIPTTRETFYVTHDNGNLASNDDGQLYVFKTFISKRNPTETR